MTEDRRQRAENKSKIGRWKAVRLERRIERKYVGFIQCKKIAIIRLACHAEIMISVMERTLVRPVILAKHIKVRYPSIFHLKR